MGLEWAPMRRTFLLVAVLLACALSSGGWPGFKNEKLDGI